MVQTGSKSGKEYINVKDVYVTLLMYMQSTSCEMLGLMKHRLESRLPGETSITADDTTLMAESEELKSLLMKVKGEWKKLA